MGARVLQSLRWLGSGLLGFAKASPTVTILIIVLLIAGASAWWAEHKIRQLEREAAEENTAQLESAIKELGRATIEKDREISKFKENRAGLLIQIEAARARVGEIEVEGTKRREAIGNLKGEEIVAAFRKRGYHPVWK